MKDSLDTQTHDLFTPSPRRRGRPPTGRAMTSAQRQKAYRERVRAGQGIAVTVTKNPTSDSAYDALANAYGLAQVKIERLNKELDHLVKMHEVREHRIETLSKEVERLVKALDREKQLHALTFKSSESYKNQLFEQVDRNNQFLLKASRSRSSKKA